MDIAALDEREGGYTWRWSDVCSEFCNLTNDYVTRNVEPVMATTMEQSCCFEYSQDEPCDLDWESIKESYEAINHLHSEQDHFAKPVRESMRGKLIAAHDKNRENRIDMDILWCTVDALAEEYSQFSVGLDIPPTTCRSLICTEKPPSMKDLGTEGVNFSVTDSSLQNGDASVRVRWHRIPEVDTRFCSFSWILDSAASVCSTGGLNPLVGVHRADPVFVANVQSIFSNYCFALRTPPPLLGDCGKTEMKNTRHRVRKSRHNKGRRMVSRRCLGQKTRYHKRGDTTRAASQKNRGVVSRSEPTSADNSSLLTPDSTPERAWRVASAAPQHMTGYLKYLTDYTPASGDQFIDTPTMGRMQLHGRGSVNTTNMTLRDVLYVPGLEANLVSTGQLAELGYTISIGPYGCRVYKDDEGMDLVGKAHYVDGHLLELDFLRV